MKKIISLYVSFFILMSVILLINPSEGINYGKGKGRNATIQNDEELINLMDSAVMLFSNLESAKTVSTVHNLGGGTAYDASITPIAKSKQSDNLYDSLTIYEDVYMCSKAKDNFSTATLIMKWTDSYYITNSAVLIKSDTYMEYQEDSIILHTIENIYMDKNSVYVMYEKIDSSGYSGISTDYLLNKWIDIQGSNSFLDQIAIFSQQGMFEFLPKQLEFVSDYFSENKEQAFNREGEIYEIKEEYFYDFAEKISQINYDFYSTTILDEYISDTEEPDEFDGTYIFDLSDKESPVLDQKISGTSTKQNCLATVNLTAKLTFDNINNTVLEPPKKIWSIKDIIEGMGAGFYE